MEIIDSRTADFLDEVMKIIGDYLANPKKVVEHLPAGSLGKIVDTNIPLEGLGLQNALTDIEQFLKHSVNTNHQDS